MSAPTPQDATLMGVPPEIRLMIYDELFVFSDSVVIRSQDSTSTGPDLNIMQANSQLFPEAVHNFYSKNRFLIQPSYQLATNRTELIAEVRKASELFQWWTTSIGDDAQHLKNVIITLPAHNGIVTRNRFLVNFVGIIGFLLRYPECNINLVVEERSAANPAPVTQNQRPPMVFDVQAMMGAVKIFVANAQKLHIPIHLKLKMLYMVLIDNQGIGGVFIYGTPRLSSSIARKDWIQNYVVQSATNDVSIVPTGPRKLLHLPESVQEKIFDLLLIDSPRTVEFEFIEGQSEDARLVSPSINTLMPPQMSITFEIYKAFMERYWKGKNVVLRHVLSRAQQQCDDLGWITHDFLEPVNGRNSDLEKVHMDVILTLPEATGSVPLEEWRLDLKFFLDYCDPELNDKFDMDITFCCPTTKDAPASSCTVPLANLYTQLYGLIAWNYPLPYECLFEVHEKFQFWFDGYGQLKFVELRGEGNWFADVHELATVEASIADMKEMMGWEDLDYLIVV
jgi:hypothetical protein